MRQTEPPCLKVFLVSKGSRIWVKCVTHVFQQSGLAELDAVRFPNPLALGSLSSQLGNLAELDAVLSRLARNSESVLRRICRLFFFSINWIHFFPISSQSIMHIH